VPAAVAHTASVLLLSSSVEPSIARCWHAHRALSAAPVAHDPRCTGTIENAIQRQPRGASQRHLNECGSVAAYHRVPKETALTNDPRCERLQVPSDHRKNDVHWMESRHASTGCGQRLKPISVEPAIHSLASLSCDTDSAPVHSLMIVTAAPYSVCIVQRVRDMVLDSLVEMPRRSAISLYEQA